MAQVSTEIYPTGPQAAFLASRARYPGFVGGWGSGKTAAGIWLGVILSEKYAGNQGVIFRKNFTDLRDSTMSDFTRYTGKRVKVSDKSFTFPNGSKIVFHHLDELSGIKQNINLGWFMIEQAEEFDSEDLFMTLRGRLRRILTPPASEQEMILGVVSSITGLPALRAVCSDWVQLSDPALDRFGKKVVNPNITDRKTYYTERDIAELALYDLGISTRKGYIIANTNGHNWIWRLWKQEGLKDTELFESTAYDNPHLPRDFLEDLQTMKEESPSHYRRFVLNSWEDTDTADKVIPYQKILDAVGRDLRDYDDSLTVISCDPAEFGDDKSCMYVFKGLRAIEKKKTAKKSVMETAGNIVALHRTHEADKIIIDDIGIGAGVRARVREILDPHNDAKLVVGFNSGRAAQDKVHYVRMRDEVWGNAAQLFKEDYVSILPGDDVLVEDLAAHTYSLNSKGQMCVARKRDIKKELGRSPDDGEAFVAGLWACKKARKRIKVPVLAGAKDDYDPLTFGL